MLVQARHLLVGDRCAVQLGVVRALDRLGIRVSEVVATSMGALVGAGLARGASFEDQTRLFHELLDGRYLGSSELRLAVHGPGHAATYQGGRYHELLRRHFGDQRVGELPMPFYCSALSLSTGMTRYFGLEGGRSLPLADALYASSCLPGAFEPLEIDGESYIDGGMAEPLGLNPKLGLVASLRQASPEGATQ